MKIALLLCAAAAWAAPLTGTWKLNRQKSTIGEGLPSFIHDDTMGFRPGGMVNIQVPPSHFIAVDPYGDRGMYRVDISDDQRTLTVRRVKSFEDQSGSQFKTLLILEKQ